MPFFDFNYVTPAPNDENVDEVTQINANLDKMETRLSQFQAELDNTIQAPIPVGTEAVVNGVIAIWDGAAWQDAQDFTAAWSAWTAFALDSSVVARPGYTPMYRTNSLLKKLQLSGGLQYVGSDTITEPWPSGRILLSDTAAGGIPVDYLPYPGIDTNSSLFLQVATSLPDFASGGKFSGARIEVQITTLFPCLALYVHWQGDHGGGDFVDLDGAEWWYV